MIIYVYPYTTYKILLHWLKRKMEGARIVWRFTNQHLLTQAIHCAAASVAS